MGGSNTTEAMKTYRKYQNQVTKDEKSEGMSNETEKAYAKFDNPTVEDSGIELGKLLDAGKNAKDGIANFYGRDVNTELKSNPNSIRPDGTKKGSGFLGGMKRLDDPSGVSSEISIGVDWGSGEKLIPTMVPTLDSNEIKYLLSTPEDKIFTENPELGKKIEQKAVRFAKEREAKGLPFFAQENESIKQKPMSSYNAINSGL